MTDDSYTLLWNVPKYNLNPDNKKEEKESVDTLEVAFSNLVRIVNEFAGEGVCAFVRPDRASFYLAEGECAGTMGDGVEETLLKVGDKTFPICSVRFFAVKNKDRNT